MSYFLVFSLHLFKAVLQMFTMLRDLQLNEKSVEKGNAGERKVSATGEMRVNS